MSKRKGDARPPSKKRHVDQPLCIICDRVDMAMQVCRSCREYVCSLHTQVFGCAEDGLVVCESCEEDMRAERDTATSLKCRKLACECGHKTQGFMRAEKMAMNFLAMHYDRECYEKFERTKLPEASETLAEAIKSDPEDLRETVEKHRSSLDWKGVVSVYRLYSEYERAIKKFFTEAKVLYFVSVGREYGRAETPEARAEILDRIPEEKGAKLIRKYPEFLLLVAEEFPPPE